MADWKHIHLGSSQGTRFNLDFQTGQQVENSNKPQRFEKAKNGWVNVHRADLDPSDKVRLVVTSVERFVGNSNSNFMTSVRQHTDVLDLECAEQGRFTAPLPELTIAATGYTGNTYVTQKIALVVNGEWQEDPINDTHDFIAQMAQV